MAGSRFQDNRPLRPGRSIIVAYGRLWHDFYLRHARSSLPDACPDAVRTCVTAADDEHSFAFGIDKLLFRECFSVEDAVLLRQHIKCKMDAFQFTTGDDKVAGGGCAGADGISVEACGQFPHVDGDTHLKTDAFGFQHIHTAVYHFLGQLEVGNSVAQQSARHRFGVEYRDFVAAGIQPYGNAQSGRARTDNGYFLSVAFGAGRYDVALAKGGLGNGGLILADSYRSIAGEFQHARLLAKRRTDASRKFGKVVRFVQHLIGFTPFSFIECVLKLRLLVAQRTCPVAKRYAALHAA